MIESNCVEVGQSAFSSTEIESSCCCLGWLDSGSFVHWSALSPPPPSRLSHHWPTVTKPFKLARMFLLLSQIELSHDDVRYTQKSDQLAKGWLSEWTDLCADLVPWIDSMMALDLLGQWGSRFSSRLPSPSPLSRFSHSIYKWINERCKTFSSKQTVKGRCFEVHHIDRSKCAKTKSGSTKMDRYEIRPCFPPTENGYLQFAPFILL